MARRDPPVAGTDRARAGLSPSVTALPVPLSVLDLAPVGEGSDPATALRSSLTLAAEAERRGYRRYWVAEHHNMPGIASSAPAVLLAHAAGVTSSIRLGSGGVMLPNHASLVVAEQFGMLEALHPGRIDLGIGRAPGTDQLTALALRRSRRGLDADDFPDQLVELMGYFDGRFPEGHPFRSITAVPGLGYRPALWLLGSSDYSARAAGALGLPFSFAHHFAAANTLPALAAYRGAFRPSEDLAAPYVMLGVNVVAAETDERARFLAARARWPSCACGPGDPVATRPPRRRPPTGSRPRRRRRCGPGPPRRSWAAPTPCGTAWTSWSSAPAPTS